MRPRGPTKIQTLAHTLLLLALLFVLPASTLAQVSTEPQTRRSWGYVFGGVDKHDQYEFSRKVGSLTQLTSAGFGWEWLKSKGMALGVEGAASADGFDSTFSVSYHFENLPKASRRLVPFATVGGTISWGIVMVDSALVRDGSTLAPVQACGCIVASDPALKSGSI